MVLYQRKLKAPLCYCCPLCVLRFCYLQISPNGHPIGHGHAGPIAEKEESTVLDHKSEADHLASVVRDSADLKTSEEFKGLLVRQ